MALPDNFAVFILTHGRPDDVLTYRTLERQGYTGQTYIVIDDEDKAAGEYKKRFGDKVIVFDKKAIAKTFDEADNFGDRRAVVYARNACFDIAKELGLDYFLELDDDYTAFVYKFDARLRYDEQYVLNLDELFNTVLRYYRNTDARAVALAQNGDFIGGQNSTYAKSVRTKRKCMNTFFLSPHRQFTFIGRVNEDVNTYTGLGNKGVLFLTLMNVAIIQRTTQASSGGMTDVYLSEGTYRKSFYTVMYAPSCAKILDMGQTRRRLHHRIEWRDAVPCILSEKWRKVSELV